MASIGGPVRIDAGATRLDGDLVARLSCDRFERYLIAKR